ncbi:uncharacterized protein LOC109850747 isoform X1 [Asparagus officinalis]|nr:uncharacterized protein LOC109850747 isoform X1 [Asparagus officinalis]
MAASSKFDLSSSSSDGPQPHPSSQRMAATLERPGSFRESSENRIASSIPSSSALRPGSVSAQGDAVSLLQSVVSDMRSVVGFDPKSPRPGEVRRSISSILGISQDDSLPATYSARPLTSSSVEEIRRLRYNIQEGFVKASDRARAFGEAALKMDKCYNNLSRKRSRTDISSSGRSNAAVHGGSTLKMGPQSHFAASSLDAGAQKLEERAKTGAPNRKIRTSLLDVRMDARPNSTARPSGSMDRDRDVFKLANGGATPPEEKGRSLAAAVDPWDKTKMKKKRSVLKSDASGNTVLPRPHDGDRELKRGMQQKLITEARPRLNNAHGFRPNGREENYAASPTSTVKTNASVRGPRSSSGTLTKTASPNANRVLANSDDWEHQNSMNKLSVNRKRSASARSASPPVANWGGQRLQKMTRVARRSNLPLVGSSRDDFPASDIPETMAVNDEGLGFTRRPSANASQSKSRGDQALSGLSESEDSGISKDKCKKSREVEGKTGASSQKVATLLPPSRKSKVLAEEDQEDGGRKHGKISRGTTPARPGTPMSNEKLDGVATAKQMRSARINSEKIESRPGRPLTKKASERKGHTRLRHSATNSPSEFAGESDDDHEELLAAANAALNTGHESLNPLLQQNEEIFGFISAEDQEFLNQQIRRLDESSFSVGGSGNRQSLKGDLEYDSVPSSPALSGKDSYGGSPNGTIGLNGHMRVIEPANQLKHDEPFLEDLVLGNGSQIGVSICQALLSAIIEEDEVESFSQRSNNEEGIYGNSCGVHFDIDAELKSKSLNLQSFGTFQSADRADLYSYKANAGWGYHDELRQDLGSNGFVDELASNLAVISSPTCTEFQYNQMSVSDRILLELSEIGVYPEPVPYLAQSEDEDIDEGIDRLTAKLHEQVSKKKKLLLDLKKAVVEERLSQQRKLERIALDKLVGMAYEKYMACLGLGASGSKNMNRGNKQAILAFVRRTLARCRKFEETGSSCFSEPAFRDMFSSVSSRKDVPANAINCHPFASGQHSMPSADPHHGLASQPAQREDVHKSSDAFRSLNHLTEQTYGMEDQWSNKLKKKELLLDEVVGSATGMLRASSGLGGSLVSGTKGKRSERDRDGKVQSRDSASRNGTAKNVKGERKKSKPKQKLSASVNGLLGVGTETRNKASPSAPKSNDHVTRNGNKEDDAEAMDLSSLHLPEIDVADFGAQGQDIGSWLNIEDDGLQDNDFMGLQIPMDDLSEVMF